MTSKKTANSKRAALPRSSDYTKEFLTDWQRLCRTGRYDMARLKELMVLLIVNDDPLGAEWKDHELKGNWLGYRECHVGGDFLLIYRIEVLSKFEMVVFVRTGTHAELFD
jgi:mRNA interferase YafQ